MVTWIGRRPRRAETPRLKPRGVARQATRVDISDLTPEPMDYLAQAAYFELGVFEGFASAVRGAPSLASKEGLGAAAGRALSKHQGLIMEIRRHGGDPVELMALFAPALDRFSRITTGADWYELLLARYLTAGLLDDFFIRLAAGLPSEVGPRAAQILAEDAGTEVLVHELIAGISVDPQLASRLAMWGRRLVGDTLLIARSAMRMPGDLPPDESHVEPVFTELIAAHTRRMDRLGLTA